MARILFFPGVVVDRIRRVDPGETMFTVSDSVAVLIAAIAKHERESCGAVIGRLACAEAKRLGLGPLARAVADREAGE